MRKAANAIRITQITPPIIKKMKEIILWLDELKNPQLIQLTKHLYFDLIEQWNLPKIKNL